MANVSFTVRYTQSDNAPELGEITFNGVTRTASGRLDDVGNFVFAQGFSAEGYDIVIECVRTSKHRMQIRIIFTDVSGNFPYETFAALEKVLNGVPIDFE